MQGSANYIGKVARNSHAMENTEAGSRALQILMQGAVNQLRILRQEAGQFQVFG